MVSFLSSSLSRPQSSLLRISLPFLFLTPTSQKDLPKQPTAAHTWPESSDIQPTPWPSFLPGPSSTFITTSRHKHSLTLLFSFSGAGVSEARKCSCLKMFSPTIRLSRVGQGWLASLCVFPGSPLQIKEWSFPSLNAEHP